MKALDVELTCKKSDVLSDWYVIERKHHDGREWWEPTGPNSSSLRLSSRIGNATIEGTLAEMQELARAIKEGKQIDFRRCAAEVTPLGVYLESPRNSEVPTLVTLASATALADEILAIGGRSEAI